MPLSRELALSSEELDAMMLSEWNMRVATVGPGSRINLTPLWFMWVNKKIYFFCRGQKVVNLRRNPVATVLVDRNEKFPELQGAMFQGRARVLEDAASEAADSDLIEARRQWMHKYRTGGERVAEGELNTATARGRHGRWVVFEPRQIVTWDNTKLAAVNAARQRRQPRG